MTRSPPSADPALRQVKHGSFVMVSLWCASLSTNTRIASFNLEWTIVKRIYMMLHQEKELPNDSGRPLSYIKL